MTPKRYRLGTRVAPQPPISLHTMGQKRCFWIPEAGVFAMDKAKEYRLGSAVAPQTRRTTKLYSAVQQIRMSMKPSSYGTPVRVLSPTGRAKEEALTTYTVYDSPPHIGGGGGGRAWGPYNDLSG